MIELPLVPYNPNAVACKIDMPRVIPTKLKDLAGCVAIAWLVWENSKRQKESL
jgi:hypothetical protein